MNKRNVEIFGLTSIKNKLLLGVCAILVLSGLFLAGKTMLKSRDSSLSVPVTGSTTVDVDQEVQQAQEQAAQQQETAAQQTPEDETPVNPLDYGPTCGVDIINAQDDVTDVQEYLNEKQALYEEIKAEYEQKKRELDEYYSYDLLKLEDDIEDDKQDLERVQQQLEAVKQRCAGSGQ